MKKILILIAAAVLIGVAVVGSISYFSVSKQTALSKLQKAKDLGSHDIYYLLLAQMTLEHPDWAELSGLLEAEIAERKKQQQEELDWKNRIEKRLDEMSSSVTGLGNRTSWLELNLNAMSRKLGILLSRPQSDSLGWLENQNPLGSPERLVVKNQEIAEINKLFYLGEISKAKDLIQVTMKKDPENPYLLVLGAGIYFLENPQDEGRRIKARDLVLAQQQKTKDFPGTHYILGKIAVVSGNFTEGIKGLKTAWELDSQNPVIAWELGKALFDAGRMEEAEAPLKSAWQNGYAPTSVALVLIKVLKKSGGESKVLGLLKDWTNKEPRVSLSWQTLGEAYFDAKNWPESILAFKRALDIKEASRITFKLALAYDQLADAPNAGFYYKRTVEILDVNKDKDILGYAVEGAFQNLDKAKDWRGLTLFSKDLVKRKFLYPQGDYFMGKGFLMMGDRYQGAEALERVSQAPWESMAKKLLLESYFQARDWKLFENLSTRILTTSKDSELIAQTNNYIAMRSTLDKK